MNGSDPTEAQKPPLASPAASANGSGVGAKKRKKDALKPIITTEGTTSPETAGCVYHTFLV